MLTKYEFWKIGIFLSVVIATTIVQKIFSDQMAKESSPIIITLQNNNYLSSNTFYVSFLGSRRFGYLLFSIVFSVCNIYHSYLFLLVTYFSILLCTWLKIILQEPRPFWVYPQIQAIACEDGYGYPSAHVLPTVSILFIFLEIIYFRLYLDKLSHSKIIYWIGLILSLVISLAVGCARMIQGVHSLDQILFGLFMGSAVYYFFLHIIDYDVKKISYFLSLFSTDFNKKKNLLILLAAYTTFLISSIFMNINDDPKWAEAIELKCGIVPDVSPFYSAIIDSGLFFMLIGACLGIIYDINFHYNAMNGQMMEQYISDNICKDDKDDISIVNKSRIGKWNDTTLAYSFLRTCVIYLILILTLGIFQVYFSKITSNFINQFFMREGIPNTLSGFIIFAFGKKILSFLRLNHKEVKKTI